MTVCPGEIETMGQRLFEVPTLSAEEEELCEPV
jgi:hypothetical protein